MRGLQQQHSIDMRHLFSRSLKNFDTAAPTTRDQNRRMILNGDSPATTMTMSQRPSFGRCRL